MRVNETEWSAMVAGRRSYGKCRITEYWRVCYDRILNLNPKTKPALAKYNRDD